MSKIEWTHGNMKNKRGTIHDENGKLTGKLFVARQNYNFKKN